MLNMLRNALLSSFTQQKFHRYTHSTARTHALRTFTSVELAVKKYNHCIGVLQVKVAVIEWFTLCGSA